MTELRWLTHMLDKLANWWLERRRPMHGDLVYLENGVLRRYTAKSPSYPIGVVEQTEGDTAFLRLTGSAYCRIGVEQDH